MMLKRKVRHWVSPLPRPLDRARKLGARVIRSVRLAVARSRRDAAQCRILRLLDREATTHDRLSDEQISQFQRDGYVSPLTLCPPDEMQAIRRYLRTDTLNGYCPVPGYPHTKWRHIDDVVVYQLCAHPAIRERIAQLLGEDLLLWQSNLFDKPPGSSEIPWHQDRLFLELGAGVNVSAWLAIDRVDQANSCVQIIPGSHRSIVPAAASPTHAHDASTAFGRMADPDCIDERRAVPIELQAGEFMLFDEFLLHRSAANRSRRQRLGLAVRYTTPSARITHQLDGYHAVLVRGCDRFGSNRLGLPPAPPPASRFGLT